MTSLQGQLLIASADLRDPNFFHTVVLMVRHGDDGALGLVLNRPVDATLQQVWQQVSQQPCLRDDRLRVGGPCEGPLMAVHEDPALAESEIVGGLYFCTGRDVLEQLAQDATRRALFFGGFSGWGAQQLEGEMEQDSWHVLPAKPAHVFEPEVDLWDKLMREVAGRKILSALKIRDVPPDLRLN